MSHLIQKTWQQGTLQLNYVEGPNHGPELLLIHGGSSRWQSLAAIIPALTGDFHVYALDLRGHGQSSRAASYTLRDDANDLIAFIDAEIGRPSCVFGNSLGGMAAVVAAATGSPHIKSIILGDVPLTLATLQTLINSQKNFASKIVQWLENENFDCIKKTINNEEVAAGFIACDPKRINAMFENFSETFAAYTTADIFPKIHVPVMLLRGDETLGSLVTADDLTVTQQIIAELQVVSIAGVGHQILSQPAVVAEEIKRFAMF